MSPNNYDDKAAILDVLEEWLQTPLAASRADITGFVPISDAISMCAQLRTLTGGSMGPVIEAARICPMDGPVHCNTSGTAVRLRGFEERVRTTVEWHVLEAEGNAASLVDLLRSAPVARILATMPETVEQLQVLRTAAGSSQIVQVCGSRVVLRTDTDIMQYCWWPKDDAASVPWNGADAIQADGFSNMPLPRDNPTDGGQCWDQVEPGVNPYCNLPSYFWHSGAEQPVAPQQGYRLQRYKLVCNMVCDVLESPPESVRKHMDENGFVAISHVVEARGDLAHQVFGKSDTALRCILRSGYKKVVVDTKTLTVRLATIYEKLRAACEEFLMDTGKTVSLWKFLAARSVKRILATSSSSSYEGDTAAAACLVKALQNSTILELSMPAPEEPEQLTVDFLQSCNASLRSPDQWLRSTVEELLEASPQAQSFLVREGEVSLTWVLEQPQVTKMLEKAGVPGYERAMQILQHAMRSSSAFELDSSGMSLRAVSSPAKMVVNAPREDNRKLRNMPSDRDTRHLRDLLSFYFEAFSLQHNRLLMWMIEAHRRRDAKKTSGYLRASGLRPIFGLNDLKKLPRIARLLEQYWTEGVPVLLAAAVQLAADTLPVRIQRTLQEAGSSRGSWALKDPKLELTYLANLRFMEIPCERSDIEQIMAPSDNPLIPDNEIPKHTLCVASYSVSSDLSHSQSPKATEVLAKVIDGELDPITVSWENRQKKIVRQLLTYATDVVCIQGLQSIGFAERCSELEPEWFNYDDEPASNHLVHLFRELSKNNYGVTFTPTMKLPGSETICFGNAIFWKRSRWQLERRWSIRNSAACAEFTSRCNGPHILVCCSKPVAGYAKDWGDFTEDSELVNAHRIVHTNLLEAAALSDSVSIWCGDFGIEAQKLLSGLSSKAANGSEIDEQHAGWQNTAARVLGDEPITSVSAASAGKAVDHIFHTPALKPIGMLGGLQEQVCLTDFLKDGYPSDHLMQFAIFVDAEFDDQSDGSASDEALVVPALDDSSEHPGRGKWTNGAPVMCQ